LHGTDFRGEKSPSSKLNKAAVQVIRSVYRKYDEMFGAVNLAKAFKVNKSCILKVVNRETWTDVK
jgi:hypothetical protein